MPSAGATPSITQLTLNTISTQYFYDPNIFTTSNTNTVSNIESCITPINTFIFQLVIYLHSNRLQHSKVYIVFLKYTYIFWKHVHAVLCYQNKQWDPCKYKRYTDVDERNKNILHIPGWVWDLFFIQNKNISYILAWESDLKYITHSRWLWDPNLFLFKNKYITHVPLVAGSFSSYSQPIKDTKEI